MRLEISKIRPEEASLLLKEAPAAAILGPFPLVRDAVFLQILFRD